MLTNRRPQARWSLENNRIDNITSAEQRRDPRSSPLQRRFLLAISLIVSASLLFALLSLILSLPGDHPHKHNSDSMTHAAYDDDDDGHHHGALLVRDHREHDAQGVLRPVETLTSMTAPRSPRSASLDPPLGQHPSEAYVSLICDNSMLANVRVLAYALLRTKSSHPLVLLTLPFVNEGLAELATLGVIIERVPPLPIPFRRQNGKRPSFYKICRYSKIHAWSLTRFKKLVYLDPSLLIVNNIDEIFQYPEFSAVKVVGDIFNTGLFVLQPSLHTYRAMLESYQNVPLNYLGEQGFLNWFFLNRTTLVISARYNTDYAVWPLLRRNAKVFHFVPHTAPWNFYVTARREWELNFEPIIFFYWQQLHMLAAQSLQAEEYAPQATPWPNVRRVLDICGPQATSYTPKRFSIQNKFSVLIGTWDRVPLLRKLILHYQKSRLVHKIYVTWHNPSSKPPPEFVRTVRKKPPVEILPQRYDSLNNRFNPIPSLETRAVLVCDDDIRVNITDIEYAFEVWKMRPHSLVGVFPRYHSYHPSNGTYSYEIRSPERPRLYSIMLTKFMFMSSEFLFTYTCLLPARIHRYIDDHMNCEDIAMNLLVSGMTGSRPAAVMLHVEDFGTTSGISGKVGHLSSRSQCMTDLVRLFGQDTLRYNREVFLPLRKRKVV